ncbi:MAG: hypothetical protein WAU89_24710 [Candidatus Acidiferrales bacterium]
MTTERALQVAPETVQQMAAHAEKANPSNIESRSGNSKRDGVAGAAVRPLEKAKG